jgi:hypothetical protein
MDGDLGLIVEIELSVLEDPKFNLIKWYLDYITENQKFRDGYIKQHKNAYRFILADDNDVPAEEYSSKMSLMRRVAETLERCSPHQQKSISLGLAWWHLTTLAKCPNSNK